MPRVISYPTKMSKLKLLEAEAASGSNTLGDGREQTFSGATFALKFEMEFPPSSGASSRKERSWLRALLNGANATRWQYSDGQRPTQAELGVDGETAWTSTDGWEDGVSWGSDDYGFVNVAAASAIRTTIITLADEGWGRALVGGEVIGFVPSHYGAYEITEVRGNGEYRISPPLRKALTTDDYATMRPVMLLRPVPNTVSYGTFNPAYVSERKAQFVEVFDEYKINFND